MAICGFMGLEGLKAGAVPTSSLTLKGTPSAVVGANVVIATAAKRSGLNGLHIPKNASAHYAQWNATGLDMAVGENGVIAYIYLTDLPTSGDHTLIRLDNTVTTDLDCTISSTGVIKLTWGSGTVTTQFTLQTGTWYKIILAEDHNQNPGACFLSINDVVANSTPTQTTAGTLQNVQIGSAVGNAWGGYVDDVVFYSSYTDVIAHTGPVSVVGAVTTLDGTHSITAGHVIEEPGAANFLQADTDGYTYLDEPGYESGDTTELRWNIAGTSKVASKFADPSPGWESILAVKYGLFIGPGSAAARSFAFEQYDGSATTAFTAESTGSTVRAGGYLCERMSALAPDGGAWQAADLTATMVRVWANSLSLHRYYGANREVLLQMPNPNAAVGGESGQLARSRHWNAFQIRVKSGGTSGNLGVSAVGNA